MPLMARAHARYCAPRCRAAAHRVRSSQQPPAELRDGRRWVRHSAAKVPLTTGGDAASSTDPATWDTYDAVRASDVGTGIGFVLAGEYIVCIDLDHCLDGDGQPAEWAARILERTPPTWIEVSPSGDGLHIWGRADFLGGRRIPQPGGGIEVYGSGRYITVTGRRYASATTELADLDALIASLV